MIASEQGHVKMRFQANRNYVLDLDGTYITWLCAYPDGHIAKLKGISDTLSTLAE